MQNCTAVQDEKSTHWFTTSNSPKATHQLSQTVICRTSIMLSDQNMHLFGVFERNHRERHLKLEKAEHVEKGHKVLECTVSQHAMCAKHTLKYGLFRILNLSNVNVFVLYKNILLWGVRTNHEAIMLVQALQYWNEKPYMLYETVHLLLN